MSSLIGHGPSCGGPRGAGATLKQAYSGFVHTVSAEHHLAAAAAAEAAAEAAEAALPLCSLLSSMPDMQTEAGATILKHSTA